MRQGPDRVWWRFGGPAAGEGPEEKAVDSDFGLVFVKKIWFSLKRRNDNVEPCCITYREPITMSTSNSDSRKVFTANFRMLLAAASWTQTEAAQELGVSQGSVSDFTSGKRVPSTKGIESIAYRLGVPAEVFTSKVIPLDQMRKLLSGNRPSRIAESSTVYRIGQPDVPWLRKLKQRWKRKSAKRDDIRVALRVLFREQADDAIAWLNAP